MHPPRGAPSVRQQSTEGCYASQAVALNRPERPMRPRWRTPPVSRPPAPAGETAPRANLVVAVLAFMRHRRFADADARDPPDPGAARTAARVRLRRDLGHHGHPARGRGRDADGRAARRHVRQAADAAGQPRRPGRRLGDRRAVRHPGADGRRADAAGPRGGRHPARDQHHARRAPGGTARLGDGADERVPRRRRRAGPARGRTAGRARRLARAVLDLGRARPGRHRARRRAGARVAGAHRRAVRRAGRGRAVDRPGLPAAGHLQGRRLGLGQRADARPVRRRRRHPAAVGPLGAADPAAAGRPAHHRAAPGAADQPRVRGVRLRDVRDVAGPAPAAAAAAWPPGTASAGRCWWWAW